jgi:hypothetical protein
MYRDPSRKPTYDEEITARVVIRERGFEVVHPHFVKVSGWSMTLNAVAFVGFWLYWALRPLPPPPPASVECPPAVECPPLPESEPEIEPEVGPSIEAALLRGPSLLDCPHGDLAPEGAHMACVTFRWRCWRVCNGLGDFYAAGIWNADNASCVCSGNDGVLTFTDNFSHAERVWSLDTSE